MAMKYGKIAGIEKPVSRIVQGTIMLTTDKMEEGIELLDMCTAHGVNAFDSAHVYGGGQSERVVGEWLKRRGNRDEVAILTKGCHHNQDRKRVTPFDLTADLYDSLARLQTDFIDLYVLHRDDLDVPVGPIVEIFNEHFEAGRIRGFGGSNWTYQRIAAANEYAKAHDLVPFTVSSPNYGLAEQVRNPWGPGCVSLSGPENVEARTWYQENQMTIFSYSSIARGFFSGRVQAARPGEAKNVIDDTAQYAYAHPINFERLARAEKLAQEKGVTVPQIAIAYIFASPMNVFPLVASYNESEMEDNIKAFDVELSAEECAWLDLRE